MCSRRLAIPPDLSSTCAGLTFVLSEDDIAASYIPWWPYEPNKASQRSFHFISRSLDTCLKSHPTCRVTSEGLSESRAELIATEDLPTRLLRIELGGHYIKMVDKGQLEQYPRPENSFDGYASLSYYWGGPQPICLTHKTREDIG